MDAKTQDAAGETGTMCVCGHEQAKHYFGDEMHTACQAQSVSSHEPCRCREYLPVQPPATPREPALAAPTGETLANTLKEKWALRKAADFDRILDVLPKGPRCRDCADSDGRCMNEAEPRPPCDPVEHVIELLRSALAARVAAPSAPQEPPVEPSEEQEMPDSLTPVLDTLDTQELRNHASSTGVTWRANREVALTELVRRADALMRAMAEWIGASHHHDKCGNRWGQKCDCGRHSLLTREDEFRALSSEARDAD